jgi:hypothetical protein
LQANTSNMVNNRLTLLLDDDMEAVAAAATRLRQLLPQIHVDRFVEAFPLVLDVDDFELALEVCLSLEAAHQLFSLRWTYMTLSDTHKLTPLLLMVWDSAGKKRYVCTC